MRAGRTQQRHIALPSNIDMRSTFYFLKPLCVWLFIIFSPSLTRRQTNISHVDHRPHLSFTLESLKLYPFPRDDIAIFPW